MCWNIGELESRLRSSCLATEKIYSVLRRQPAFNTAIAVSVAGYSTRFVPVNAPCGQRPPSRCSQIRSLSCRSQNQTRTAHIPPLCPHRVALRLQYDGTSFHGWERKPDHAAVSTIQATVEAGLSEVYGTQIRAQAASRTDAGAHALAQVIHFDAPFALSSYSTLCRSLNSRLPSSVIATCAARVDDSFDARRHAVGRSYRYTICDKPISVFSMRFAWHVPISSASLPLLDVDKMNDAALTLLATDSDGKGNIRRDLRAFRRADAQASHTLIRVSHASVRRCSAGHFVHVDITADWFIYGMMRLLTATLVQVGLHRISVNEFRRIVENGLRENVTHGAPAKGLCLIEVQYHKENNPFEQQDTDKLRQCELGKWPEVVHPWYMGLESG